jgi:ArsR family transcriptional regulator, arsenate/arsenite/antimonite-responsive transcriptional repressor / arsenate reductase (thioredoxin)
MHPVTVSLFAAYLSTSLDSSSTDRYLSAMALDDPALLHRAGIHHALGDPLRLAIVEALALSDRSPSELEAAFEVPSNLLAHHLGILERHALVERVTSGGDRRRRYLRLATPAASDRPITGAAGGPMMEAARVLFVCTANSARSPLAEALWRQATTDVDAASAGTTPAPEVHPLAIEAAARAGMVIQHVPLALDEAYRTGDLIVTVCDQAHEAHATTAGALHWSVPDPAGGTIEDFDRTVSVLRERVERLARCVRPTDHRIATEAAKGGKAS